MKYGLEQEFFVKDAGGVLVGALPAALTPDECGFLAEARGQAFPTIREAVFSVMADAHRLECEASKLELQLVCEPNADMPFKALMESRRSHSKGVISFQNLYGYEAHKQRNRKTAGIHISFTCHRTHSCYYAAGDRYERDEFEYQPNWDWVQLFRHLDIQFKDEIKEAKRNPGFYELKPDGRIEYRSLPNNVDLKKVIKVIEDWQT